jgi:plasmid stability protein
MSHLNTPIIIRIPEGLHEGIKALAVQHGESAAVVVRALLRQAITQGHVSGLPVAANEAPRATSVRPLGRADK